MKFCCLFGVLIAIIGATLSVHGQDISSTPSTRNLDTTEETRDTTWPGTTTSATSGTTSFSTPHPISPSVKENADSTTQLSKLADCNTPTNLDTYCGNTVPQDELDFFGKDTSLIGVLGHILFSDAVKDLQEKCEPGEWCLSDKYQTNISNKLATLYSSPICVSDSFWRCLEDIEIIRKNCNESELYFVMSTIGLLCDMQAIDNGVITLECFTRSMEALHVLYSDMSRANEDIDVKDMCSDYNKKMTDTFACAVNACTNKQRVFLQDFGPWSHTAATAETVLETCDVQLHCQKGYPTQGAPSAGSTNSQFQNSAPESTTDYSKMLDDALSSEESKLAEKIAEIEEVIEEEEIIDEFANEMFEDTTSSSTYSESDTNSVNGVDNEQGMDTPENEEAADQTFVYGMITVTAVVVVSLTLIGVLTFKRFSRMRKNYKMGYSQMSEEESRMLRNEYN